MKLDAQQIKALAPKDSAFKAGEKLANSGKWLETGQSDRALWGAFQGSGKKPYLLQIDTQNLAFKCTCPSRQFPCKHAIGLLLRHAQAPDQIEQKPEPERVSEWLAQRGKRAQKAEAAPKSQAATPAEQQKRDKAKLKRQADRKKLLDAGLTELKDWLKDMLQLGLLELPSRNASYFDTMAKRMVDAKASGLANWINALKTLDFKDQHRWQTQAMRIIAKLNLLISAAHKLDQLEGKEQQHIQRLLGWTFSQKELLKDPTLISIQDQWLVLGGQEEAQEELIVKSYWLLGAKSKQDAFILQFESQYSAASTQPPIIRGTVLDAELAFYPGTIPHRAFVKRQSGIAQHLDAMPEALSSWADYQTLKRQWLQADPWTSNRGHLIQSVRILPQGKSFIVVDQDNCYQPLDPSFSGNKRSSLLLFSHQNTLSLAFVEKAQGIFPLGLLTANQYLTL